MSTPFDYVKDASQGKKNLMRGTENDELAEGGYNPWVANLAFSMHPSSILHANLMNLHHQLPNRAQYEFYLYSLPKANRYAAWAKEEKNLLLRAIQEYYDCSATVAKQYEKLLGSDDKKKLLKLYEATKEAPSNK